MRKGEKQDVTYHFISEEDFKQKINEGFFAEWKSYITVDGVWYYGTALEDLENADDKSVIILTPDGYRDVANKLSKKPISIYIYANNATIKKRLLKRGDDKNEAQRRLEHDNEDFKGIENEVDRIVYNNDGIDIDDVVRTCKQLQDKKTYLDLLKENQELKKQLEYLRSGEYYNQLRFERDMLQNIVDNVEVSKEDKEFIDMTHRNTELLEENKKYKEVIDRIENKIKLVKQYDFDKVGRYELLDI